MRHVPIGRIGKGAVEGKDREGKAANYALVQELAAEFKKRNGSLVCAELLGLRKPEGSSVPEARTEQYYAKRPCARMVEVAAQIWTEYLEKRPQSKKKELFYPLVRKKVPNNVLYNINIPIFAAI